MSKCKACGAEIVWIRMTGGKMMPCDAQKIPFRKNFASGELSLVLPDGRVVRGDLDLESEEFGYQSHFATCPAANKFRRGK